LPLEKLLIFILHFNAFFECVNFSFELGIAFNQIIAECLLVLNVSPHVVNLTIPEIKFVLFLLIVLIVHAHQMFKFFNLIMFLPDHAFKFIDFVFESLFVGIMNRLNILCF